MMDLFDMMMDLFCDAHPICSAFSIRVPGSHLCEHWFRFPPTPTSGSQFAKAAESVVSISPSDGANAYLVKISLLQ
jgi:hypothetical protein